MTSPFALALALTPYAAGAAGSLPPLPVAADYVAYGDGALCREVVPRFLQEQTFRSLLPRDRPVPGAPLTVTCAVADRRGVPVLVVALFEDGVGRRVRQLTVPSADPAAAAELTAATFAEDPKVVDAALRRYLADNAAAAGTSVDALQRRLESDAGSARAHYGLFESYAAAGEPRAALWHFNAFLRASDTDPAQAAQADLDRLDREYLRRLSLGLLEEDTSRADEALRRWAQALDAGRPDQAIAELRAVAGAAPWSSWPYDKLAAAYQELGWKRLASHWKERGRFARKVSTGQGVHKALLRRLLGE